MLVSLVASIAAYGMVGLGLSGEVPSDIVVYGLTLGGAYLLAWGVVRWVAPRADPVLLASFFGYLTRNTELSFVLPWWLLIGLAAFVITLLIVRDDRVLDAFTYTIGLLGLCLLLLPIVPGVGFERNGARLWADIGPITFQPAEFGRILIVIFLPLMISLLGLGA